MDALALITKYYPVESSLRQILLIHSWQVCHKALAVAHAHPELGADDALLTDGALLHDIGIFLTHAPSIACNGNAHYLLHGYYGGKLLRKEGFPELARICERHTGAGLSREDILSQQLPLPQVDFLPETIEEEIICYADKFYSKSSLKRLKTFEQAYEGLLKHGTVGAERFKSWHERFDTL